VNDVHTDHLAGAALRHRNGLPPVATAKVEHGLTLEKINKVGDRLAEKFQSIIEIGLFRPTGEISGSWPSREGQQNPFADRTHPAVSLPKLANGQQSAGRADSSALLSLPQAGYCASSHA
jgi:hypothetical protein